MPHHSQPLSQQAVEQQPLSQQPKAEALLVLARSSTQTSGVVHDTSRLRLVLNASMSLRPVTDVMELNDEVRMLIWKVRCGQV